MARRRHTRQTGDERARQPPRSPSARGTARLRLGVPFASARLANGLEEDGGPLEVAAGEVELPYRPHELLTVKVR